MAWIDFLPSERGADPMPVSVRAADRGAFHVSPYSDSAVASSAQQAITPAAYCWNSSAVT